jgi:hypothetical protein
VFAHSMGNNVFRYFVEWLKLEIAPKHYIQWLDEHIHAYFAVGILIRKNSNSVSSLSFIFTVFSVLSGAPLLGSTEAVRAALSGSTFGVPVSEVIFSMIFIFTSIIPSIGCLFCYYRVQYFIFVNKVLSLWFCRCR